MDVAPYFSALLGGLLIVTVGLSQELILFQTDPASADTDSSAARIVLEHEGDLARISAVFEGALDLPTTLRYRLVVNREGAAGTSASSQSGSFEPRAGQMDTLSTSQVNVQQDDHLHIELTIREGDRVVAEDVIDKTYS